MAAIKGGHLYLADQLYIYQIAMCFQSPHSVMKYILPIVFIFLLGCDKLMYRPSGGLKYPEHILDKDTNFYHYQIRDSLTKLWAFRDSYQYLFYRPFNEPNLSIRPLEKETYRLSYGSVLGGDIIISINENCITVKEGDTRSLYDQDIAALSPIERSHFYLLNKRYPIETSGKDSFNKVELDSLTAIYPQLLDVTYYHMLSDKVYVRNKESFNFESTVIPITKEKFNLLVRQINSSGYWDMPFEIKCDETMVDGFGYSLEANTKEKYKIVSASDCPLGKADFPMVCQ